MLKISVISYMSTILRIYRSFSLKCLRFPDQHIKRNIDTLNDTGYLTKFYTGSHCPSSGNEPIIIITIIIIIIIIIFIEGGQLAKAVFSGALILRTLPIYIPFLTEKAGADLG